MLSWVILLAWFITLVSYHVVLRKLKRALCKQQESMSKWATQLEARERALMLHETMRQAWLKD